MSEIETGSLVKGRFEILAKRGEGGMAVLYRAYDRQRRVAVAIKSMKADFAEDGVFLERFRGEARKLQQLQHPHIVRFYELIEDGVHAFMVLDFIEGETLRTVARRRGRPFSPGGALGYLRPICAALSYAHSVGVIHCDVKPANIMMDQHGHVFVADFGIARATESATVTFSTPGTPAYMAPEQWLGGEDVTPATDVYALGVLLCELLTGRQPYRGETAPSKGHNREKIMWEHLHGEPPMPSHLNSQVPAAFDDIILRCLEKAPARRYQSVDALLGAFEAECRTAGITEEAVAAPVLSAGGSGGPQAGDEKPGPLPLADHTSPAWSLALRLFSRERRGALVVSGGVLAVVFATGILATAGGGRPTATATPRHFASPVVFTATEAVSIAESSNTPDKVESPTRTARPTSSRTPSPTTTSSPSATLAPTPTPQPTATAPPAQPVCSYTGTFTSIWSTLRNELGCPVGQETNNGNGAAQTYSGGLMYWVSAVRRIYAFGANGRWASVPDSWVDGDLVYTCSAGQAANAQRGFGRAWCTNALIQSMMGGSTSGEHPAQVSLTVFRNGFILRSEGATRVAFNSGMWQSR